MIGYPIGLWDEANNFPILRKGVAASHPALDFNRESIGVIDAACFPGSSGSPILIYKTNYVNKLGVTRLGATQIILLGLLTAGPVYTCEGTIEIKEIPTNSVPIVSTNQMIHLGYYVKAKEIMTLIEEIKTRI